MNNKELATQLVEGSETPLWYVWNGHPDANSLVTDNPIKKDWRDLFMTSTDKALADKVADLLTRASGYYTGDPDQDYTAIDALFNQISKLVKDNPGKLTQK